MKIKQIIKNIASRVLANELRDLNSKCKFYEKLAFNERQVILPSSAASSIISMLPSPNHVVSGRFTAKQLLFLNSSVAVHHYTYILQGKEYSSEIRFVADTRPEEEKRREKGVTIEIIDFRIKIFIPLRNVKMQTQVCGIATEVETYVWDLYRAGIRIVSDTEFNTVMEFVVAQNKVLKELNAEM